jgi:hypothetical protein
MRERSITEMPELAGLWVDRECGSHERLAADAGVEELMPGTAKRSISLRSPVFGSSVSVTISFEPALPTYMTVAALAAADVIATAATESASAVRAIRMVSSRDVKRALFWLIY